MNLPKIISKKTVFESRFYKIEKTTFARKGLHFTKDMILWDPIVFVLPVTENYEIYLEYQYRDAYGKTLLEVVAGHVDPKEDFAKAAERELLEETGLTAKKMQKVAVLHPSANIRSDIHVFVASGLSEGEQKLDEEEEINIVKMPLSEAIEKCMNNELEVASHQAVLFKLKNLLERKEIVL